LQISKTTTSSGGPGAVVVYTLSFRNVGGSTATGVVLGETVPDRTVFHAAASSPGWSCADGSPPGTACTLAVPNLPPGGMGSALFAVRVDADATTGVIRNTVIITDSEGNGAEGGAVTNLSRAVPALHALGVLAALAVLTALARRRWPYR
jgi:uncharacterized repeat protein (TIGR01451 family)